MISDEDLFGLPENPELAFVQIERLLRQRTIEAIERSEDSSAYDIRIEYMSRVLAAKNALDLDILNNWGIPSRQDEVFDLYSGFTSEVDHCTMNIRVRHARRIKEYSVAFDSTTKSKLRHLLNQIKETIDKLEISDARKQSFYNRISALEAEIDRERTRYEALAALWLDLCDKTGEGFQKLEPVRRWIDSIGSLFGKAKAEESERNRQLPAPPEPRRIEPPRREPDQPGKGKNDDIPF